MKGLLLAKEYYNHLGAPMLRERFAELFDRIAVGLVGPGSECFGFDDDISRDHDWGPAFCMWLTADDYQKYVAFYPEVVRLKKIASRCFTLAQSGQYNLPRSLKRGELFAANWALSEFCAETMSLIFLLNKRYTPFYKWIHRAVKDLPLMGAWAHAMIHDLIAPIDIKEKPVIVEAVCADIIRELRSQGLTDSPSDFLLDHAHNVRGRIQDDGLRRRFTVTK